MDNEKTASGILTAALIATVIALNVVIFALANIFTLSFTAKENPHDSNKYQNEYFRYIVAVKSIGKTADPTDNVSDHECEQKHINGKLKLFC